MIPWPQRLVVGLPGPQISAAARRWLAQYRPAGVILFTRNVVDLEQLRGLCRDLHTVLPGLEISVDHEGGPISHLAAVVVRPPAPWSLGEIDDPELTFTVHRETANRLRALGVDRVLGPVADVMTQAKNPVIGCRAFGAEGTLVARHVTAAVSGLLAGGVGVCIKHWPGHGSSRADTHLEASACSQVEDENGEAPFLAGIRAGARAVMVGHLPTHGTQLPATLDRSFLDMTRRRLAFAGQPPLLFADDVTMGALRGPMVSLGIEPPDGRAHGLLDPGQLPAAWLAAVGDAGCDRILLRGIPWLACPVAGNVSYSTKPEKVESPALPAAPSYLKVAQQMGKQIPREFWESKRKLLWIDLSEGDRWWPIGAISGFPREELLAQLQTVFKLVGMGVEQAGSPCWDRLLVTSFRPWSPHTEETQKLLNMLNGSGLAVVCGHPELGPALAEILPSGWELSRLYDLHSLVDWCPEIGN